MCLSCRSLVCAPQKAILGAEHRSPIITYYGQMRPLNHVIFFSVDLERKKVLVLVVVVVGVGGMVLNYQGRCLTCDSRLRMSVESSVSSFASRLIIWCLILASIRMIPSYTDALLIKKKEKKRRRIKKKKRDQVL